MKSNFFKFFIIPILSGIVVVSSLFFSSNLLIKSFSLFDNDEIPIILAPKKPIKEKPKNPQGQVIEHTTQEFWGIFDNDNEKNDSVEILKPLEPETPPVNIAISEEIKTPTQESSNSNKQSEIENSKHILDENIKENASSNKSSEEKNSNNVSVENIRKDETILVPLSRPKFNKNNEKSMNIKNNFYVQLASFNNKKLAENSSKILEEKLAVSLEGNTLSLMEVNLGKDKGFWWRIVTNLISRDEAESICSLLKVEGQNCIVRSKK